MRRLGLTLCFLVSSFSARADSVEDRVAALEARVKALEEALHTHGNVAASPAIAIDGTYTAKLPNGGVVTAEFSKGKVVASTGGESKAGTYEVVGQRVVITADGKTEVLEIAGDGHLKTPAGGNDKLDFIKAK